MMYMPLAFQRGVIYPLTILQHEDIGIYKSGLILPKFREISS